MYGAADTGWVVARARELGFDLCGVAPAQVFPELQRLPEWLRKGYAGEMGYLADPRRTDPARVLPGAKSVIVCALNYNTAHPHSTEAAASSDAQHPRGWISRYAWGDDYHDVLGEKLRTLASDLRRHFSEPGVARWHVDTGPVQERVFAKHAGLGWLGKNTLLLNEQFGSWLFLGVILTTLELSPSLEADEPPPPDLCGNCRLCLDACPTGALVEPYLLDARRCISYLTIELRASIPEELRAPMGRHVFGCDICQDVCPWNRKSPLTTEPAFAPRGAHQPESLREPSLEWLASLSEVEFRRVFRASPVKRAKWRGMLRNVCVALANSVLPLDVPRRLRLRALLGRLAESNDALVAECAAWALSRIQSAGQDSDARQTART